MLRATTKVVGNVGYLMQGSPHDTPKIQDVTVCGRRPVRKLIGPEGYIVAEKTRVPQS